MMSLSSCITPEQSLTPIICAAVAFESLSGRKCGRNTGILSHDNVHVRTLAFGEQNTNSILLLQEKEEEDWLFSSHGLSSLDTAMSIRGGSSSPLHVQQQHDHSRHPLAFAMNLHPHLHHHASVSPLHEAMVASPTVSLPPDDAEKLRQAAHDDNVQNVEVIGNMDDGAPQTVTNKKEPRRRFRWFRLRRRQRDTAKIIVDTVETTDDTSSRTQQVPLRFMRAAKGDPALARQRYLKTLAWRKQYNMDTILSEPHVHFEFIKQHYPHYFHLRGRKKEPVYFEMPPRTNLKALREGGVTLDILLRHYAMVTEFMWQYVERNDLQQSIYIVDLEGIRISDFCGECVDFVRRACAFCNQHYPERSGCILVVNVPTYFKLIWRVVKRFADKKTLAKVKILRGKDEILETLLEFIPMENIPPEYGGTSMPLGEAPEEVMLWNLMRHNNHVEAHGTVECGGKEGGCPYCSFEPARTY